MKPIRTDDRGVSPVIGVILMVAITVLLASTAAVFFLEFGNGSNGVVPQTAFDKDYKNPSSGGDTLTITHSGGDTLKTSELKVVVSGASATGDDPNSRYDVVSDIGMSGEIMSGDSIVLDDGNLDGSDVDLKSAKVTIVWEGEGSSQTSTIYTWKGPDY